MDRKVTVRGGAKEYTFERTNECALDIDRQVCTPYDQLAIILQSIGKTVTEEDALVELMDHTGCATELCVLKHQIAETALGKSTVDEILQKFFRIEGPSDPTEWLSNFEIDGVLDQIERKYGDFLHILFHMRDFATYPMHKINLKNLNFPAWIKKSKHRFGVVINTDDHTKGGTHWFALYGDFTRKPYTIEYFNSSGDQPLREVHKWMRESAAAWSKQLNVAVEPVVVSNRVYQRDGYSCGTYALYYIMSRLAGTDIEFFRKDIIDDEMMHKFREYLFRTLE